MFLSERRARSWFCFRAALDSSDGSGARGARTRGCSPLDRPTATDSKSGEKRETEFSDYPRKGGGKRGGRSKNANSAHGRMATRRTGRRRAGGGRATLELSALTSPPAPIAISRARSLHRTSGRLFPSTDKVVHANISLIRVKTTRWANHFLFMNCFKMVYLHNLNGDLWCDRRMGGGRTR